LWCCRRTEKISRKDSANNEEELHTVKEERAVLNAAKRRLKESVTSCVGTDF
jgi:hypothetical protein